MAFINTQNYLVMESLNLHENVCLTQLYKIHIFEELVH